MTSVGPAGSLTALSWRTRLLGAGFLIACSVLVVSGLALLGTGLEKTFLFEPTTEALARDRVGKILILAGSVTTFAAAGWARWMHTPIWACVLLAAPAFLIGGLTLFLGESLLPHLAALVTFPAALSGLIGTLIFARPFGHARDSEGRNAAK